MLDLERETLKLFNASKNFREFIHDDLNLNFFGHEFADFNDIDGHQVLSILVNDSKGVTFQSYEEAGTQGVMRSQVILYCRFEDVRGLNKEQSIRVNGNLYTVQEFHAISNYVWRILLERNE